MRTGTSFRFVLPVLLAACCSASCGDEDADDLLSRDNAQGYISGAAWSGGPGAARVSSESGVIIRIFESGTLGAACDIAPTTGRRLEVLIPSLRVGRLYANKSEGHVEAWNGETGEVDHDSVIEIDQASKEVGGVITGRVRFGSSYSSDQVEGSFSATVCEQLP